MKNLYINKTSVCSHCGAELTRNEQINNMGVCNNCKCVK